MGEHTGSDEQPQHPVTNDLLQQALGKWENQGACKSISVSSPIAPNPSIEILTTNSTAEPGLTINVTAGSANEDFGFYAQKAKISNCIQHLNDSSGIDFLGTNPEQIHFVYKVCQLDDFALIVEKKGDGQIVTSRVWVRDDESGKDELDKSQRAELLSREITKYTDQLNDSTDVTPHYDEEEKQQLLEFHNLLQEAQAKWETTKPPQGHVWRNEISYEREGFWAPLCMKTQLDINDGLGESEWSVQIMVSDDIRGIQFREQYQPELVRQVVAEKGLPNPDEKISVLLKSPDLEEELLLIEVTNKDGKPFYTVSDLWVRERHDSKKSSAVVEGEAFENAIRLTEEYLSDAAQNTSRIETQQNADMIPYTEESAINLQRDTLLRRWRFVLGDKRISHPVSNRIFIELDVVKDESGNARVSVGNFQTENLNGFYTQNQDKKLNLPLDPQYLAKEEAVVSRCFFDIETDVRRGRFRGEILPIDRCDVNVQALLSNYNDKIEILKAGQVMFIPGEKQNAALFIENFEGNIFVTQVEILPTVKMAEELSPPYTRTYDVMQIFPALCRAYQEGRLWLHD